MQKYKGNPILNLRLPRWQLQGLHYMAKHDKCTTSAIVRALIGDYLMEKGISEDHFTPVDGQLTITDYE